MNNLRLARNASLALIASSGFASAVITLESTDLTLSLGTGDYSAQYQLDAVTIGGKTYDQVTFGAPTPVGTFALNAANPPQLVGTQNGSSRVMYRNGGAALTTDAISAQTDNFITTGQANLSADDIFLSDVNTSIIRFDFGSSLTSDSDAYIAVFEIGSNNSYDGFTLQLLDSSLSPIGNSVALVNANFGNALASSSYNWVQRGSTGSGSNAGNFTIGASGISLSEFGSGLNEIRGIQFTGNFGADISGIALVAVPEPSTVSLIIAVSAAGCVVYRRRKRHSKHP